MKRTEFNELIAYLKNRPEEAKRLREVLGALEPRTIPVWITATMAGELIGKSGKWVREHIDLFPTARTVQRGTKQKWLINKDEVMPQFNVWLFNNHKN